MNDRARTVVLDCHRFATRRDLRQQPGRRKQAWAPRSQCGPSPGAGSRALPGDPQSSARPTHASGVSAFMGGLGSFSCSAIRRAAGRQRAGKLVRSLAAGTRRRCAAKAANTCPAPYPHAGDFQGQFSHRPGKRERERGRGVGRSAHRSAEQPSLHPPRATPQSCQSRSAVSFSVGGRPRVAASAPAVGAARRSGKREEGGTWI